MGYLSPPPLPAAVVVYKDVGGLVSDYEARTAQYRAENREVRLHECRSACTLALSLPNVCVYPDAKVKFHQAYNAVTREVDPDVSARLFSSYPAAVQARLGYLTREYRVLSGTELIALGVRNCNGGDRVMTASRDPRRGTPAVVAGRQGSIAPDDPLDRLATQLLAAFSGGPDAALPSVAGGAGIRAVSSGGAGNIRAAVTPSTPVLMPPRRPSADAFGKRLMMETRISAKLVLINGARPILESARFAPSCIDNPSTASGSSRENR